MKFLLLALICFKSFAYDLSPWETRIEIPKNVLKLREITRKSSIDYQIVAYEAAMDLLHLAKANHKIGNISKALHFMGLASKIFPYRDDLTSYLKKLLSIFVAETNVYIKNKRLSCEELKQRVELVSELSSSFAMKINDKAVSCHFKVGRNIKEIGDIDLTQWIQKSNSFEAVKNRVTLKEASLFMQAQTQLLQVEEQNKVYKLRFPKRELVLSSLKLFNGLRFDPEVQVSTSSSGQVSLTGHYRVSSSSRYSLEGHCRFLKPFFDLPAGMVGSILFTDKTFCGTNYNSPSTLAHKSFYQGDWSFGGIELNLMSEATKYSNNSRSSNSAFYRMVPRLIDMKVDFHYEDGSTKTKSFKLKIDHIENFFSWLYLGELVSLDPPKVIDNKAMITFLKGSRYSLKMEDVNELKGLKNLNFSFDGKSMLGRLSKALKVTF